MNNIFFDTSILSEIAWRCNATDLTEIRIIWNKFMDDVEKQIPGLFKEPFFWVFSDALFLEIIGLGRIKRRSNDKNIHFRYSPFKDCVIKGEWRGYRNDPDKFVSHVVECIDSYVSKYLTPRNLCRQAWEFQKTYKCHEHSHFIFARVKKWRKSISEKPEAIENFRNNIMWDTILKYPFIGAADINDEEIAYAEKFWGQIIGILFRNYYDAYNTDVSMCSSLLGWCFEIDRTGSFFAETAMGANLLKPWADMVDADSIHFALIGRRQTLKTNEPVVVITCDSETDIRRRLAALYITVREMRDKGFPITITPGTILCFSTPKKRGESLEFENNIDVQQFINTLE